MRIAILLTFAVCVPADEPTLKTKPITVAITKATPAAAKAALELHPGIERVDFAPQVSHLKADLALSGVQPAQAIQRVAKAFGCDALDLGKQRWRIAPAWQIAILETLKAKKVTKVAFADTTLGELLDWVRAVSGLPIHLDREVDSKRRITLQVTDESLGALLALLTEPYELKWELRYGVIYIAQSNRFDELPILPPQIKSLKKRRVALHFDEVKLPVAANYMSAATGKKITVPRAAAARTVSIQARDVSAEQALALMLYPYGWTAVEKDGAVHVEQLKN